MSLPKALYLGDEFKEFCGNVAVQLAPGEIFALADKPAFADGSDKAYNDHIKTIGTIQHMNNIKEMLGSLKGGPASAEASRLLDCIGAIEKIQIYAGDLTRYEKQNNGFYSFNSKERMDQLYREMSKLIGESGGPKSMSEALDALNSATGYELFDKKEMIGLSLLASKADDLISGYEIAYFRNSENESRIRKTFAETICKEVDDANKAYDELAKYTSDKFLPEQIPYVRKAATERIQNIDDERGEVLRNISSHKFRIDDLKKDIHKLEISIDTYNEDLNQNQDILNKTRAEISERTEKAKELYQEDPYKEKDTANISDEFIEDITTYSFRDLAEIDKRTIQQLDSWDRMMDYEQLNHCETSEKFFEDLAENPSDEYASMFQRLPFLAAGKADKKTDTADVKAFYEKLKAGFDEIFPAKDNRSAIAKFFNGKPVSDFEKAIGAIETEARDTQALFDRGKKISADMEAKEEKLWKLRRDPAEVKAFRNWLRQNGHIREEHDMKDSELFTLDYYGKYKMGITDEDLEAYDYYDGSRNMNSGRVYRDQLKKGLNELFGKLSAGYTEKKNSIVGYKEVQVLRARKVAVENQIAIVSEDPSTLAQVDTKEIKDNLDRLKELERIETKTAQTCAQYRERIESDNKALEKNNSELAAKERDLAAEEEKSEKLFSEREAVSKLFDVCDTIKKKAENCSDLAEKASKHIDAFKEQYTEVKDSRALRYKADIDNFNKHVMDNKGIRSNSDEFTRMANSLKALQDFMDDKSGVKRTDDDLREKLDAVKTAADAYLKAKSEQKMVAGTTRRKSRLAFARRLSNWVEKTKTNLEEKPQKVNQSAAETRLRKLQKADIKIPGFLGIENADQLKDMTKLKANVSKITKYEM